MDRQRHPVRPLRLLGAATGHLEVVLLFSHGAAATRGGGRSGGVRVVGDAKNDVGRLLGSATRGKRCH